MAAVPRAPGIPPRVGLRKDERGSASRERRACLARRISRRCHSVAVRDPDAKDRKMSPGGVTQAPIRMFSGLDQPARPWTPLSPGRTRLRDRRARSNRSGAGNAAHCGLDARGAPRGGERRLLGSRRLGQSVIPSRPSRERVHLFAVRPVATEPTDQSMAIYRMLPPPAGPPRGVAAGGKCRSRDRLTFRRLVMHNRRRHGPIARCRSGSRC